MAYKYDPVKAHEYYEKHKKLKGKTSTKGFNQSQREQAKYAKHVISEEKSKKLKSITQKHSEQRKSENSAISESAKSKKQVLTEKCKTIVAEIKKKIKGMSPEKKAELKSKIMEIRQRFSDMKKGITAQATSDKKSNSESHKTKSNSEKAVVKANAQKQYEDAIAEIRSRG